MPLTPVEQLALDDAAELVPNARVVVVIGTSALALEAEARFAGAEVRLFSDRFPTPFGLEPALVAGADLVLGVLPKSLAELEDIATLVAAHASDGVVMTLAGREKYLTRSMNETLARSFATVSASRGRQKSRALRASSPREGVVRSHPVATASAELGFDIVAHGGAFAGTKLDLGTRVLLQAFDDVVSAADGSVTRIVDLGCGTGVLATVAARRFPDAEVIATDVSWAAVTSAALTAERAGVDITVLHDDAGASIADASVDLVLLNPPFHDGTAVDEHMATDLFRQAARMLRPGGLLAVVYNSHLPHRAALEALVGPTRQLTRTPKFTVTVSRR